MNRFTLWSRRTLLLIPTLLLPVLSDTGNRARAGQNDVEAASAKAWVGKKAKGFTLPGIDGKPVDVTKNLGKRPIVLVFYRGVW